MLLTTLLLFACAGLAAGFLAGLLGIGGGLIVVPMLYFYFSSDPALAPQAMHLALGSSLAFIVINSGFAAWTHTRLDGVRWSEVRRLGPGLAIGSLSGAALANVLPSGFLARFFGLFLLVMAVLIISQRAGEIRRPPQWLSAVIGAPMGLLASLAGVGGGVMAVPWLLARGHRAVHAVATSSVCTVLVAALGASGYILFADDVRMPGATGYVYWPAVIGIAVTALLTARFGARLAHRVDQKLLRRLFALLLVVVGLRLLIT